MDSNIDFTTPTADLLTMDLDTVELSALTPGEAVGVMLTVSEGTMEIDSWHTTYYADSAGEIHLVGLARMWNSYILSLRSLPGRHETQPLSTMNVLTVTILVVPTTGNAASCVRRLWYARRRTDLTVGALFNRFAVVRREKSTFMDADERLSVLGSLSSTLGVTCTYLDGSGIEQVVERSLTVPSGTDWGWSVDVSPSVVSALLPSGSRLKEYTVRLMGDTTTHFAERDAVRYVVEDRHFAHRSEFLYFNKYGAYESLWFLGSETLETEREAEYGYVGGQWHALDLDTVDTYEVSTGYGPDAMVDQVRDLSESPLVWLLGTLGQWHRVTPTSVDISRRRPTNAARACSMKYRHADRDLRL